MPSNASLLQLEVAILQKPVQTFLGCSFHFPNNATTSDVATISYNVLRCVRLRACVRACVCALVRLLALVCARARALVGVVVH